MLIYERVNKKQKMIEKINYDLPLYEDFIKAINASEIKVGDIIFAKDWDYEHGWDFDRPSDTSQQNYYRIMVVPENGITRTPQGNIIFEAQKSGMLSADFRYESKQTKKYFFGLSTRTSYLGQAPLRINNITLDCFKHPRVLVVKEDDEITVIKNFSELSKILLESKQRRSDEHKKFYFEHS